MELKHAVLTLLVVQSTAVVLLMRYSRTRTQDQGHGPLYASTAAVFVAEVLKLLTCMIMAGRSVGGVGELYTLLSMELWTIDTAKCAVPAMAYTIQNNLLFVALANLEAPTYQVSYQSKTLFTALFSVLILGRRLKPSQWLALTLLVVGTVLVSDPWGSAPKEHKAGSQESFIIGILAVLIAAILSASSSVYFEMILKKESSSPPAASLWLRNIQLGIFATPLAAVAMLLHDGRLVTKYGVMQGFNGVVWSIVVLNGLGGLLVAATMKYADSIAKCFATAIAIVSGTLISVPLFGFTLSTAFGVGASCTVIASTVYSLAPDHIRQPGFKLRWHQPTVCFLVIISLTALISGDKQRHDTGDGHGLHEAAPHALGMNCSSAAPNKVPLVNFFSCAQGAAYERFLPIYAFFALQHNYDAVAELVVPNASDFKKVHSRALASLRHLFGHHAVCVRDYRQPHGKGVSVNTRRYLEVPERAAAYTYIGDVDILITSPVVSPERLMQMALSNLSYSNVLRRGQGRLTGVMLVKTASFYTTALRKAQRTIPPQGNDEAFLARLVENASLGLPPHPIAIASFKGNMSDWSAGWWTQYRPLHGLHLSNSRGPGSTGVGKKMGIPGHDRVWCPVLHTPQLSQHLCADHAGRKILQRFANYTMHLAATPYSATGCLNRVRMVAGSCAS